MTAFAVIAAGGLHGQGNEWRDPEINEVNRLPMHSNYFAYESPEAAAGGKASSERFLSLNGTWNFLWVRDSGQRPTDFFRTDYDDKSWGTMNVPGLWEANGYGDPVYVNIGYAWRNQFRNDPPNVPVAENHVGSYRRTVNIPAGWNGQRVIAHFGSVTSNIYLWVNGKYVGYSEDSKLEAEFDITKYVKPGQNLIAFQVFRWCDGTYLEDQDFFRFSGVGRDCYLYSRPEKHIADIRMDASLTDDYTRGQLDVKVDLSSKAAGSVFALKVEDSNGNTVASHQSKAGGKSVSFALDAGEVKPWTAETPNLYSVTATLSEPSGKVLETILLKTGFRNVTIEEGLLKVNGQYILVKGVNRHEMDPDMGYVMTEERMLQDISILKENNFNAVRTCHYPDVNRWYELCDRYGLYLVAEANVESHGMGYGDSSLAKNPAYAKAHLERNQRNVFRSINHPSVVIWSLGNEAGDGPNFSACYDWIKSYDPTRPVQYEQAVYNYDTRNTDIVCPMYRDYEGCEKYCSENPAKPLIQCEYAHAMGNSMGGFAEYWDLIRKYPSYQGGFIWDFVDQSQRKTGKDGVMVYGYGGDWNPYDASDYNFCDNGLISPDRIPNPHMHEVKYWQQPVWTSLTENGMEIYNEYSFRDISNYVLSWEILCDGQPVLGGVADGIEAGPRQTAAVALPYSASDLPAEGELLLNVKYTLKSPEPMLPAGHVAAYQQFTLREYEAPEMKVEKRMADRYTPAGEIAVRDNDYHFLIVEGGNVRLDFNRSTGFITRYDICGRSCLEEGSSLRPNFWRAPTDNDFGAQTQIKNRVWDNPEMKLKSLEGSAADGIVTVSASYDIPAVSGVLELEYRINNAGEMVVKESLKAGGEAPDMLRFGMRMEMPAEFDRINYYGRGPWENYSDRKESSPLGIYHQTADEQFYPYIRPQETGNKTDIRWWHQCNLGGRGLEFTSAEPFSASALHYSQESLDEGAVKTQRHSQEIPRQPQVFLCIDKMQQGLGCVNSWGAKPLPQYMIPYADYTFEFKITPALKLF